MTSPFRLASLAGQLKAVPHHIGQFLNLGILIVVREQNGPTLTFEVENFFRDSCRRGNHNGGGDGNLMLSTVL